MAALANSDRHCYLPPILPYCFLGPLFLPGLSIHHTISNVILSKQILPHDYSAKESPIMFHLIQNKTHSLFL